MIRNNKLYNVSVEKNDFLKLLMILLLTIQFKFFKRLKISLLSLV